MSDLRTRLGHLADNPPVAATPLPEIRRRAVVVRRRRRASQVAGGLAVALLAVGALQPLLARQSTPSVTFDQPQDRPAPVPAGWERETIGALSLVHPKGWDVLSVVGESSMEPEVVIATRPLNKADVRLAQLTRNDVRFSEAFPEDAVVFVVGGDRFVAPHPPSLALGKAVDLPRPQGMSGAIRARTGRVPQSILQLAGYIGPAAPPDDSRALDKIAASVRLADKAPSAAELEEPVDNFVREEDQERWRLQLTRTIAFLGPRDASHVEVRIGGSCVGLASLQRPFKSNIHFTEVFCDLQGIAQGAVRELSYEVKPAGPADDAGTGVLFVQVGTGVERIRLTTADGRSVTRPVTEGFVLARTPSRVIAITGLDPAGRVTSTVPVT